MRSVAEIMWADAIKRLARADRLNRDFFQPVSTGWEPPVDLLETETDLIIVAALPGVASDDTELVVSRGEIAIVGIRRLPAFARPLRIHRMELPHGRFERRVALPPGEYELTRRDLQDGCLIVNLRKLP